MKMGARLHQDWPMYKPRGARVPIYNLKGMMFGDWKVVKLASARPARWLCRCKCGTERVKRAAQIIADVKRGNNSCGCHRMQRFAKNAREYQRLSCGKRDTHRDANWHGKRARLYKIWAGMRTRCFNKNDAYYHRYGGAGVSICPEWDEYPKFKEWALANGYSEQLTLDRIDPAGNYEPDNCRWVDWTVQASNKRKKSNTGVRGVTKYRNSYHVTLMRDGHLHQKTFRTLEEARQYRQELEEKYLPLSTREALDDLDPVEEEQDASLR